MDAWKADTARLCLVPITGSDEHVSSYLTQEWYDAVYNNAILLLYRPSPYLPHPGIISEPMNEQPDLVMLLSAAKASIESYNKVHRNRRLNYSWITLHGIFIAGLAFVYSVSSISRDRTMHHALPSVISIMEICRQCSNLLVALAERWNSTRQTCDLFDRMSTAMIRDALNATCSVEGRSRSSVLGPPLLPLPPFPQQQQNISIVDPRSTRLPIEEERLQNTDIQMNAPEAATGSSTPITRLEEILALVDSAYFPDALDFLPRRESMPSGHLASIWPFDVPFGAG
jgi:hypothetical protein